MKIPLLMSPVREEDLSGREFLKREEGNMTEVQSQAIAAIEAKWEGTVGMSKFSRQERNEVYEKLLGINGAKMQATVAAEEMSEVIKELTKMLRGELDREHMSEEIADARIMMEQMCQMLNINDSVDSWMDYKIEALKRKVEK